MSSPRLDLAAIKRPDCKIISSSLRKMELKLSKSQHEFPSCCLGDEILGCDGNKPSLVCYAHRLLHLFDLTVAFINIFF